MCGVCGCGNPDEKVSLTNMATGQNILLREGGHGQGSHSHSHHEGHHHSHSHHDGHEGHPHHHGADGEVISLETAVLARNDRIAEHNRVLFVERGLTAINLVSAPGAGKTSLLEKTILALKARLRIYVIEGDQMTLNDAERIRAAGAQAVQVNTGAGCHLEADMVKEAVNQLEPEPGSLLMIENVGNLVCPAMFDLGEHLKAVVMSTTEGEDKPLKYPHMFRAAAWVIINKLDLAPHTGFDEAQCRANIAQVNPEARIFLLSARTGEGMPDWLEALQQEQAATAGQPG